MQSNPQKKNLFPGSTSGIMYRVLALSDMVVLNAGLWDIWFQSLQTYQYSLSMMNDITCKVQLLTYTIYL